MPKNTTFNFDFEKLFHSIGTAYIVIEANDPVFTVIEQNKSHADNTMVNREDVIGKPVLEAFPDTSEEYVKHGKSRLLESFRKVIATGQPDTMPDLSYDLKDKDGNLKTLFWEVKHYPVFDKGVVKAIYQQTTDITNTISAKRELTIAQDQLEQALAYSEVGTWIWDVKKDSVIADKNLAKLFGINDGTEQVEFPISDFTQSIHPDDRKRVENLINRSIIKKLPNFESEYRTFDYDGNVRWLLARGHIEFDKGGDPIRFPGIVVDITERKITENNLHMLAKANTLFPASLGYKQTLESIASMIVPSIADWCVIDILEDDRIQQVVIAHSDPEKVRWAKKNHEKRGVVDVNASNGAPWVIRTGTIEHNPIVTEEMLETASDADEAYQIFRDLQARSTITAPLKIDAKTIGAITFISTDSHKHYDKNDVEIAQALANRAALAVYNANLFEDAKNEIEERSKLQAELEKFNLVLEKRVKERTLQLEKTNKGLQDEIRLRHKLENQRLQHYIDLNKTKDEFISLASHQLRTPATGVKQYLGMVLEGMSGDITDMQETLLKKAYTSNERQLTIVSDLLKVAQIDAGKVHIRQEAVNLTELLSDVIKEQEDTYAMRKQSVVFDVPKFDATASADPDKIRMVLENMIDNASKYSDPGKKMHVKITEKDTMVAVHIKDNGVGVAPEDVDKLFEKFNRIHNHLSNHVGGTGLGLYWAKKVVDLHGGVIKVSSVLGEGSTFSVYLPKHGMSPSPKTVKIGAKNEK